MGVCDKMTGEMGYYSMAEQVINDAAKTFDAASTQLALMTDTILQVHKEKDCEWMAKIDSIDERHLKEKSEMRKHYQRIILAISLTLLLIVGSLIGGLIYLISNYDIGFQVYQEVSAEGGGDSTVEDGIRYNYPSFEKEDK